MYIVFDFFFLSISLCVRKVHTDMGDPMSQKEGGKTKLVLFNITRF